MKWVKTEEKVSNMISGGLELNARILALGRGGREDMLWNLPEKVFPSHSCKRNPEGMDRIFNRLQSQRAS